VKNARKMYNIKFIRRDFKTSVTNTNWFTLYTLPLRQKCTSRYNREVCAYGIAVFCC